MTSPAAEAAHSAINIAERYISEQQMRIDRQRELVAKLERDGGLDMLTEGRRALAEMERTLAQLRADYAAAQERLALALVEGAEP
jgi:uncharacterized protein YjgD (DUF1641 family)